jgi:biopolymer transport protein ExbB
MQSAQALGVASVFTHMDAVGKVILFVLLAMSIATWYLIITKTIAVYLEKRRSAGFLEAFCNAAIDERR